MQNPGTYSGNLKTEALQGRLHSIEQSGLSHVQVDLYTVRNSAHCEHFTYSRRKIGEGVELSLQRVKKRQKVDNFAIYNEENIKLVSKCAVFSGRFPHTFHMNLSIVTLYINKNINDHVILLVCVTSHIQCHLKAVNEDSIAY